MKLLFASSSSLLLCCRILVLLTMFAAAHADDAHHHHPQTATLKMATHEHSPEPSENIAHELLQRMKHSLGAHAMEKAFANGVFADGVVDILDNIATQKIESGISDRFGDMQTRILLFWAKLYALSSEQFLKYEKAVMDIKEVRECIENAIAAKKEAQKTKLLGMFDFMISDSDANPAQIIRDFWGMLGNDDALEDETADADDLIPDYAMDDHFPMKYEDLCDSCYAKNSPVNAIHEQLSDYNAVLEPNTCLLQSEMVDNGQVHPFYISKGIAHCWAIGGIHSSYKYQAHPIRWTFQMIESDSYYLTSHVGHTHTHPNSPEEATNADPHAHSHHIYHRRRLLHEIDNSVNNINPVFEPLKLGADLCTCDECTLRLNIWRPKLEARILTLDIPLNANNPLQSEIRMAPPPILLNDGREKSEIPYLKVYKPKDGRNRIPFHFRFELIALVINFNTGRISVEYDSGVEGSSLDKRANVRHTTQQHNAAGGVHVDADYASQGGVWLVAEFEIDEQEQPSDFQFQLQSQCSMSAGLIYHCPSKHYSEYTAKIDRIRQPVVLETHDFRSILLPRETQITAISDHRYDAARFYASSQTTRDKSYRLQSTLIGASTLPRVHSQYNDLYGYSFVNAHEKNMVSTNWVNVNALHSQTSSHGGDHHHDHEDDEANLGGGAFVDWFWSKVTLKPTDLERGMNGHCGVGFEYKNMCAAKPLSAQVSGNALFLGSHRPDSNAVTAAPGPATAVPPEYHALDNGDEHTYVSVIQRNDGSLVYVTDNGNQYSNITLDPNSLLSQSNAAEFIIKPLNLNVHGHIGGEFGNARLGYELLSNSRLVHPFNLSLDFNHDIHNPNYRKGVFSLSTVVPNNDDNVNTAVNQGYLFDWSSVNAYNAIADSGQIRKIQLFEIIFPHVSHHEDCNNFHVRPIAFCYGSGVPGKGFAQKMNAPFALHTEHDEHNHATLAVVDDEIDTLLALFTENPITFELSDTLSEVAAPPGMVLESALILDSIQNDSAINHQQIFSLPSAWNFKVEYVLTHRYTIHNEADYAQCEIGFYDESVADAFVVASDLPADAHHIHVSWVHNQFELNVKQDLFILDVNEGAFTIKKTYVRPVSTEVNRIRISCPQQSGIGSNVNVDYIATDFELESSTIIQYPAEYMFE